MNIVDPIHKVIHIHHPLIKNLIDTKEFQRLRNIKQLGVTNYFFLGAEHSRFGHSLGTYHIAKLVISRDDFNNYVNDDERLYFMIAALLHDVGHGPFSHTFEIISKINHETWTEKIILGDTEINQVLKSYQNDLPKIIASIINKKYSNPILNNLLSGDVDVDRMDYLLRDSYFCGVPYGQYNLNRMIEKITVVHGEIVWHESGVPNLEGFLFARYQMFKQVYLYKPARELEETLRILLNKVINDEEKINFILNKYPAVFEFNNNLKQYLELDNNYIMCLIQDLAKCENHIMALLAQNFLKRQGAEIHDQDLNRFKKPDIKILAKNNQIVNIDKLSPFTRDFKG